MRRNYGYYSYKPHINSAFQIHRKNLVEIPFKIYPNHYFRLFNLFLEKCAKLIQSLKYTDIL